MAEKTEKKKKDKKSYFANLKLEFKKIVWPDKKTAGKQTLMIIVAGIIIGILIVLFDTGIQALLSLIA